MRAKFAGLIVLALCASGCTTYYKVHDPTTNKDYYTTELRKQSGGAVTLKDARTGNEVSVQNSEVKSITKEEWESGKNTAPAPMPAKEPATPFK